MVHITTLGVSIPDTHETLGALRLSHKGLLTNALGTALGDAHVRLSQSSPESRKLMPRSKAMCWVAMDSISSTTPPCPDIRKQPRPIGETNRSVVQNLEYSMDFSSWGGPRFDELTTN